MSMAQPPEPDDAGRQMKPEEREGDENSASIESSSIADETVSPEQPAETPESLLELVQAQQDEATKSQPQPAQSQHQQTTEPQQELAQSHPNNAAQALGEPPQELEMVGSPAQTEVAQAAQMETDLQPSVPSEVGDDSPVLPEAPESEIMKWRYRLLPTMQVVLFVVIAVFFVSGLVQLAYLQASILRGTEIDRQDLPSLLPLFDDASDAERLEAAKFEAAMIMESYVVERRYHHVNTMLMTMAWIRYLGFATGMILSVVGASFILGMLREEPTDVSAKSTGWQVSLTSSSPGLIMVILGVMLMFTTITSQQRLDVGDAAVYFSERPTILNLDPTPEAREPLATREEFSGE